MMVQLTSVHKRILNYNRKTTKLCNYAIRRQKIMTDMLFLGKQVLLMKQAYLVKFQMSVLIFTLTHLESLVLTERTVQQQLRCGDSYASKTSVL